MQHTHITGVRVSPQRLIIALGVVCSLFVSTFDSFRLSSAGSRASSDVAAALLSPLYPVTTKSVAQDGIATVLVTEESNRRMGVDVPFLPYDKLALLVDALAQAKPAAIFLDFTYARFKSDPEGLKAFADAVRRAKADGTPVLTGPIGAEPEFAELRASAEQVGVHWYGDETLEYPFAGQRPASFGRVPATMPSAAKRLYDIVCETEAGRKRYKCDLVGMSPKKSVSVEWARGAHPGLVDWWGDLAKNCPRNSEGVREAFGSFITALSRNLFYRIALQEGTGLDTCTYHLSGPVDILLNRSIGREAALAMAQRLEDPADPTAVEGRVVMVGSALGNDTFDAPGQGRVPGVLHHAMALDNMLSRGEAYRRSAGSIGIGFEREADKRPLRIDVSNLVEIILSVAIGFLVSGAIRLREAGSHKPYIVFLSSMAAFSLVLVIPGLVALVTQLLFHWAAVNVFGVAATALSVTALLEWERVGGVTLKWVLVGALAVLATFAGLAGAFVTSTVSAGPTFAFASACLGLAVLFAVLLPSSQTTGAHLVGGTP